MTTITDKGAVEGGNNMHTNAGFGLSVKINYCLFSGENYNGVFR